MGQTLRSLHNGGNLPALILRLITLVTLDAMAGAANLSNLEDRPSIPTAFLGSKSFSCFKTNSFSIGGMSKIALDVTLESINTLGLSILNALQIAYCTYLVYHVYVLHVYLHMN